MLDLTLRVPRLGMQGGAPAGWVVGCKLLGTGSGSIVGFWFARLFCVIRFCIERTMERSAGVSTVSDEPLARLTQAHGSRIHEELSSCVIIDVGRET